MVCRAGPGLAGGRPGRRHRPGRELPGRDISRTSTTPSGWPIRSTWCASPTAASTRCAGGSRTRRSATGAAKHDPLYRIRKLLLDGHRTARRTRPRPRAARAAPRRPPRRAARCVVGQGVGARRLPHRRSERGRPCSSTRPSSAASADEVEEIRSLGDTLERWRTEILNHHRTGASNGPTEGLNLCVKKVKRAGRGFTCFEHYRLRVLLHAGGVTWPRRPSPPRIRTRSPHSNA